MFGPIRSQLVQLWNTVYRVRVLITRRHEFDFVTIRRSVNIVTEK